MKREANFTIKFRHWLKANADSMPSAAFEVKQTTGVSIPFDSVKEHQIDALQAVKSSKGLIHKISDETRSYNPFDVFFLRNAPAFVVLKFPKAFHLIDVDTFCMERDRSKRKSITSIRAKEISTVTVRL